jgi:hypothetical protein
MLISDREGRFTGGNVAVLLYAMFVSGVHRFLN